MMHNAQLTGTGRFLRHSLLGSEAVYRVIEIGTDLVTAEVVEAPGLEPGTRVRMLTKAAAAMEHFDRLEPITVSRNNAAPVGVAA
jgi:hypothetical protein